MGVSNFVIGIRPPDEKFKQMQAVWRACTDAGLDIPDAVENFFEGEKPDPSGVRVNLTPRLSYVSSGVTEYNSEHESGFEIHLKNLPDDITIIRIVQSI